MSITPIRRVFARGWTLPMLLFCLALASSLVFAQQSEQNQNTEAVGQGPEVVHYPSHVGEVTFPHRMHSEVLEMDCVDCHHGINAPSLDTPHPQYFENSTVRCRTCHEPDSSRPPQEKCSVCHDSESIIPHHQLSSKVAIHTLCSECHEIGNGQEASSNCEVCHSGSKSAW